MNNKNLAVLSYLTVSKLFEGNNYDFLLDDGVQKAAEYNQAIENLDVDVEPPIIENQFVAEAEFVHKDQDSQNEELNQTLMNNIEQFEDNEPRDENHEIQVEYESTQLTQVESIVKDNNEPEIKIDEIVEIPQIVEEAEVVAQRAVEIDVGDFKILPENRSAAVDPEFVMHAGNSLKAPEQDAETQDNLEPSANEIVNRQEAFNTTTLVEDELIEEQEAARMRNPRILKINQDVVAAAFKESSIASQPNEDPIINEGNKELKEGEEEKVEVKIENQIEPKPAPSQVKFIKKSVPVADKNYEKSTVKPSPKKPLNAVKFDKNGDSIQEDEDGRQKTKKNCVDGASSKEVKASKHKIKYKKIKSGWNDAIELIDAQNAPSKEERQTTELASDEDDIPLITIPLGYILDQYYKQKRAKQSAKKLVKVKDSVEFNINGMVQDQIDRNFVNDESQEL